MCVKQLDYEAAGVKGLGKDKSRTHFAALKETLEFAKRRFIETPFYTLYEAAPGLFHAKCADGVGTKVLLAELAEKHDTIGIDLVASLANDCIRVGAKPIAMTDIIDSPNPEKQLVMQIQQGILEGARRAQCAVVGGETASLSDMMNAPYSLNGDCVGEVREGEIIRADGLAQGDAIIGLRSSGAHTNGISLLRHALFKKWGGKFDAWAKPPGHERELVLDALEPTRIYVKEFFKLGQKVAVKAAAHITGDAYAKFLSSFGNGRIGFEFDNFEPQQIFKTIQKAGNVSTQEMFSRFNMGWGFAVIVAAGDADDALAALGEGEVIGRVTDTGKSVVKYKDKTIAVK